MKATIARPELQSALSLAASASSLRSPSPALMSIRLLAAGGSLNLLGCDGEMWCSATIGANVEVEGSVCVQQKLFSDIVSALGPGEVTIEIVGTSVVLSYGASEWKMLAMPAEEFPPIPDVSPESSLSLPFSALVKGIDGVSFACGDDATRPVLTGVLFEYTGSVLTMVATDTHRLAVHRVHQEGIGSPLKVVVPEKALKAIKMLALGSDEKITVGFDDLRLTVEVGGSKVVSQLLSGNYPNWERVVPGEFTRSWLIDREELLKCVDRAMIMAKDSANRVRFKGDGETVVVSSRSEDKGEAKEEIKVVSRNGDLEIAFNGRFLKEAVQAFNSDGVTAEMTEASRPAVIRPTDDGDDHFCIVMPMAIG